RFVMHLRMPGQIWDDEAKAIYNYHRWYRREDGRYLQPDPIGLAGGEPGYFAYARSNPLSRADRSGLGPDLCDSTGCDGRRPRSIPRPGFGGYVSPIQPTRADLLAAIGKRLSYGTTGRGLDATFEGDNVLKPICSFLPLAWLEVPGMPT